MDNTITMAKVLEGLRFIARNRHLSNDELADGLEKLGCTWTSDDVHALSDKLNLPNVGYFEGMHQGRITDAAYLILNMKSRNDYNRYYGDDRFLSIDDNTSVYHFVRIVTGDDSFTKENIDKAAMLRNAHKSREDIIKKLSSFFRRKAAN